jgi:Family of unknown function (DUF6505)
MLKFPRTLRLDPSDTFVFERAAEPGEWAVPGSVLFWAVDVSSLTGKARAAFRSGFLGLRTLGFSTLVEVAEITAVERDDLTAAFADTLLERFGAPDRGAALQAARDEVAFASSLCDQDLGTVIGMHRTLEDGAVREQFRTLRRREPGVAGGDRLHAHARAFEIIEVEDEPEEQVDLVGLMETKRS